MLTSKRTSRVVLNRSAVEETRLAVADGVFAVAKRIAEVADERVPDAPPLGKGLIEGGAAIVWVDGKKVDGTLIGGKQVKKPRQLRLTVPSIVAIAGFGFPGRFVEKGTVDTAAEPFLSPSMDQVSTEAPTIMAQVVGPQLAKKS